MELKVIQPLQSQDAARSPWYAEGLRFTCSQCGNCCTGPPGYVWISTIEIGRLAEFLKLSPKQVIKEYCRKIDGNYSLKETVNERGEYDCVFLREEKPARAASDGDAQRVVLGKRSCTIYPVRPLQCRTWPFWTEVIRSPQSWERAGQRCHGIDAGARHFPLERIESLRDAKDWPQNPPTSKTD